MIKGSWVDVRPYGLNDKKGDKGKDKGKGMGKGFEKGFDKGKGKGYGFAPQGWGPPSTPAHPYSPPNSSGYGASSNDWGYQGPVSGYNPAQYGQQAQYSPANAYGYGGQSGSGAPAYGGYSGYGQS